MNTKLDTKGEFNRQKIVEAANILFYQKGFNKTSFTDVAGASGIPKGNFYFYFKSKNELLHAVIEARFDFIKNKLVEYEAQYQNPKDRLKRLAEMPLTEKESIIRYGCPIGSLTTELAKNKAKEREDMVRLFDLYVNWAGQRFTEMGHSKESKKMARHMLSRLQGIIVLANVYTDKKFLQQEIEQLKNWLDSLSN